MHGEVVSDRSQDIGFSGLIYQPNCEGCPFQGSKIVPPNGNLQAAIAIVGESPGWNEERTGRGFVGRSGKLLDVLLKRNGIERASVWITNSILCKPRSVVMSVLQADGSHTDVRLNQDQAKLNAMIYCRPRLLAELGHIRAKSILALGGMAFESVTGEWDGIQKRRGGVHQPELHKEYAKSFAALNGPLLKSKPTARKKAARKQARSGWRLKSLRDENGRISPDAVMTARAQLTTMNRASPLGVAAGLDSTKWTEHGPGNLGGRTRSLVIHPTKIPPFFLPLVA